MEFRGEELAFYQKAFDAYNQGDCGKAVELAKDFLAQFPQSPLALFAQAAALGAYALSSALSAEEKKQLLETTQNEITSLFNHPDLAKWPRQFQAEVKNEYYWRSGAHIEQYRLGVEEVSNSRPGHYYACVAASILAYERLPNSVADAEDWARRSLYHFKELEKTNTRRFRMYEFAAQALACLGRYEEALACLKNDASRTNDVLQTIEQIKKLRAEKDREAKTAERPSA